MSDFCHGSHLGSHNFFAVGWGRCWKMNGTCQVNSNWLETNPNGSKRKNSSGINIINEFLSNTMIMYKIVDSLNTQNVFDRTPYSHNIITLS